MRAFDWRRHGAVRFAAVAGLVAAFAGCTKDDPPAGNFEPPTTWSISGTVSGDVASGVTVRVVGTGRAATTASDGRYTISGLTDGTYTLDATRTGYAFSPATRSVTVAGADVPNQNFTSYLGLAISGKVTGEAAAGVTLTLRGPAPATTARTVTTDADGNYGFFSVVAGVYTVTPSLTGGWTFLPANCTVTVATSSVTGPDFASIPPVHAISGRVTGAVTAGVTVTLSGDADAVAVTDATGNYSFAGLTPGSYVVTPSRTGYAFTPAELEVALGTADATGRDFVAVATHRIAGWVTGELRGGVTMTLSGAASAEATTDAAGYFEFPGLVAGAYVVTPSLGGYTFSPPSQNVTLAAADVTNASFSAAREATYSVTGTVTGAVLAGVTMTLEGTKTFVATTDALGAFALTGVPAGTYLLTPSLEDYDFDPASRLVTVSTASVAGQDFYATVDPAARTLTGTVSGDAVAGISVSLAGVAPVTATVTVTTDAAGNFAFRNLADGIFLVTPSLAGHAFTPANCMVTVSGPSVTNVEFSVATVPHTISGTVSGAVAAGVTITLSGDADAVTVTAAGGTYAFTNLPDGAYTVTPSLAGYVFGPAAAAVTLQGAHSPGVDFVAAATHTLSGTISGDVAVGVTVTLSGAAAGELTTVGTGAFAFTNLPDGTYVVTPSLDGYTFDPVSRVVALAGANMTAADFTATRVPTWSVSGTVSGAVIAGVTVTLAGEADATTTTDGTGAYLFPGLRNGSYMVIPSVAGHAFNPASRAFRINGANVTAQNFTALP